MREHNTTIYFATGNKGKYVEAAQLASIFRVRLKQLMLSKVEIQSDDLVEIASFAAKQAADASKRPVVVEDAGLFVNALRGFPGPYSSYVFQTIGNKGMLKLLGRESKRKASFRATVAFCRPRMRPICFSGVVNGAVTWRSRGTNGFGFDPIFTPNMGDGRTFAEMQTAEKNFFSHRAKAFAKFFTWLTLNQRRISLRQVK